MAALLVASCLLAGLFAQVTAGILRVPITRAEIAQDDAEETLGAQVLLGLASQLGLGQQQLQDAGSKQAVTLLNHKNMAYYGKIRVGEPGTDLTVVFDTGSASLWVPTKETGKQEFYEASASSTYQASEEPFQIAYGSGDVSGRFCRDEVGMGDFVLKNFTFAEVSDTSGIKNWAAMPFDGVLGLGFPELSVGGYPTVMQALVESGQLAEPVFGFYLGNSEEGQLVLGGVDPQHIASDFTWVKVVHASYWSIALESVKLGDFMTLSATSFAIMDSGTSLLAGPEEEVRVLALMLGATPMSGLYVIPCSKTLPSLSFTFGGRDFALEKEDLVVQQIGHFCVLGLQAISLPQRMWIVGDVFMRKYYVQFDWGQKRVGLALASTGANKSPNLI